MGYKSLVLATFEAEMVAIGQTDDIFFFRPTSKNEQQKKIHIYISPTWI